MKYEKKLDFERTSWCWDCCAPHTPERRQAIIRRMSADVKPEEIRETWGEHLWPRTIAGERSLHRDLRAVFGDRSHLAADRLATAIRLVLKHGIGAQQAGITACVNPKRVCDELRRLGFMHARRIGWISTRRAA